MGHVAPHMPPRCDDLRRVHVVVWGFISVSFTRMTRKRKKVLWPPKYYQGLTPAQARAREKEIQHFGSMNWKDPAAYVGFATDRIPTRRKKSSYTVQWQKLFPYATTLKQRARVTGVPLRILDAVFRRGSAAWRTGHRPGQTTQSWSYPRVSSFLLCGKTHYTADSDLVRETRRRSAKGRAWFRRCPVRTRVRSAATHRTRS